MHYIVRYTYLLIDISIIVGAIVFIVIVDVDPAPTLVARDCCC